MTIDDPNLEGLSPDAQNIWKRAYKMRLHAMEKAWAIGREFAIDVRADVGGRAERSARKVELLERIAVQMQSIHTLVENISNL
jgi:hypothetical protein